MRTRDDAFLVNKFLSFVIKTPFLFESTYYRTTTYKYSFLPFFLPYSKTG